MSSCGLTMKVSFGITLMAVNCYGWVIGSFLLSGLFTGFVRSLKLAGQACQKSVLDSEQSGKQQLAGEVKSVLFPSHAQEQ